MANTKRQSGRPAKKAAKRAPAKHVADGKVGPHEPILASPSHFGGCDNGLKIDAKACKQHETVEQMNERHIAGAKKAFDSMKAQVEAMLAAAGIKVYQVKDGDPLPEELQATVDAAIQMGLMVATGDKLNAGEALYGFIGWLTTRLKPIHLCSNADVPPVLDLMNEFIAMHGLPGCRPDWDKRLVRMAEVKPDVGNTWPVSMVSPTREQATKAIMGYLFSFGDDAQNAILAHVLDEVKARRVAESMGLADRLGELEERKQSLFTAQDELENVLRGRFSIVRE